MQSCLWTLVDTKLFIKEINWQVGCEDGRVRLFEITADGLNYSKSLDQQDGKRLI